MLLHALAAIAPTQFPETSTVVGENTTETLPITSYPCQWKPPQKRKESHLKMSEVNFEKHVYGKRKKVILSNLEDFDPRPAEFRGTAKTELATFFSKVCGKGLAVSLLFDPSTRVCMEQSSAPLGLPDLPSQQQLEQTVSHFKTSLRVSEERARLIEQNSVIRQNGILCGDIV